MTNVCSCDNVVAQLNDSCSAYGAMQRLSFPVGERVRKRAGLVVAIAPFLFFKVKSAG